MKVFVTLDYWDGSQSKTKEVDLDGTSLQALVFDMMAADVAGFSVTKKLTPQNMVNRMELKKE